VNSLTVIKERNTPTEKAVRRQTKWKEMMTIGYVRRVVQEKGILKQKGEKQVGRREGETNTNKASKQKEKKKKKKKKKKRKKRKKKKAISGILLWSQGSVIARIDAVETRSEKGNKERVRQKPKSHPGNSRARSANCYIAARLVR